VKLKAGRHIPATRLRCEAAASALPRPRPCQPPSGQDSPCLTERWAFIGEEECHSPRKAKDWLSVTGLLLEEAVLKRETGPSAEHRQDGGCGGQGQSSSDSAPAADVGWVVPRICYRCLAQLGRMVPVTWHPCQTHSSNLCAKALPSLLNTARQQELRISRWALSRPAKAYHYTLL